MDLNPPITNYKRASWALLVIGSSIVSYFSRGGIAPDPLSKNTDSAPPTTHCKTEQNAIHIF